MKNFIAVEFSDIDFKESLRMAIGHVLDHATEELTFTSFQTLIPRAFIAFSSIPRIDNFGASLPLKDHSAYILRHLRITEVNSLDEFPQGFYGYVIDAKQRNQSRFYSYYS